MYWMSDNVHIGAVQNFLPRILVWKDEVSLFGWFKVSVVSTK